MHPPDDMLTSLFGPEGARCFAESSWPERHLAVHGPLGRLPDWLRAPALGSLEALADRYDGQVAFGKGAVDARTITADANAGLLYKLGFTVYLFDIARLLPGGEAGLKALERELGLPADCGKIGAFASPEGDGVSWHFDGEDVISVQLTGTKTFGLAPMSEIAYPVGPQFGPGMLPEESLYAQASNGFPVPNRDAEETVELVPGSVLFLPRGTWHRSVAGKDSFSISIGLRPPPLVDHVLPLIRALLLQDARWRQPLYGVGFTDARRDAALARARVVLQALPQTLGQLSTDDLEPTLASRGADRTRENRLRFQKVPMSTLSFTQGANIVSVRVTALDAEWIERMTLETNMPSYLAASLEWLSAKTAAFSMTEFATAFPALDEPDRRQLLALLCKAAYLKALRFPLLGKKSPI